jgi:DNA-binding transcriptional regulator/RsmH inhibitor MraZ
LLWLRGLARYTRRPPEPVPSRAREMAKKEWLAKRTTEKTRVKRISKPRVTTETTKRTTRFIFPSSGSLQTRVRILLGKTVQETGGIEKKFTLIGRQYLLHDSGEPRLLSANVSC